MSKLEGGKWRPDACVVLFARTFSSAVFHRSSTRCLKLKEEGTGEAIISIHPARAKRCQVG